MYIDADRAPPGNRVRERLAKIRRCT